MQFDVNIRLYIIYICILIIHKARNSETFKIVHLLASVTFNAPYSHYRGSNLFGWRWGYFGWRPTRWRKKTSNFHTGNTGPRGTDLPPPFF